MDGRISQHCGEYLVVNESREPVRHRVVFEAALAVLSVVTPVFDRDHDEGRQAPLGVLRDRQVVESIADELELAGAVVGHQNGGRGAIAVGRRDVNEDFPLGPDGFFHGLQRGVVAAEEFAVGQSHLEFELSTLGIAPIGEVWVDGVTGANDVVAIARRAGIFGAGSEEATGTR